LEMRKRRTTPIPHREPSALVTSGVFALSRNPIYLGDVFVLTGAVLWWGVWPALILVPIFMWVLTIRFIRPEEERLIRGFGEDYAVWSRKTRRWL